MDGGNRDYAFLNTEREGNTVCLAELRASGLKIQTMGLGGEGCLLPDFCVAGQ